MRRVQISASLRFANSDMCFGSDTPAMLYDTPVRRCTYVRIQATSQTIHRPDYDQPDSRDEHGCPPLRHVWDHSLEVDAAFSLGRFRFLRSVEAEVLPHPGSRQTRQNADLMLI